MNESAFYNHTFMIVSKLQIDAINLMSPSMKIDWSCLSIQIM